MVPIAVVALLFTRLDGPTILAHEARRRVLERVALRPGSQISEIAEELALDPKTVVYHVRQLERIGRLRVELDGRARRVFPPGPGAAPRPSLDARAEAALWVLHLGGAGPADVSRALRIPRGTAGSLLDRLVRTGLAVREGRSLRPAPEPFSAEGDLGEP